MAVPTPTISSNGQPMDASCRVLAIDVVREVNRLPYARLTLADGEVARRQFATSDSGFFDPGRKIEIKLRWEGEAAGERVVFSGLVVAQSVEADGQRSLLTVDLKDEALKLARAPASRVFSKKRDDEVFRELLDGAGLAAGELAQTRTVHPELVQYACSDWDFMLSRADVNGLLVCVSDGKVALSRMALDGAPGKSFDYGLDRIYALELAADAESQYGSVASQAWDPQNQKLSSPLEAQDASLAPGDLRGAELAQAIGGAARLLANPAAASNEELQAWADATLARSRLALVRGRLSVPGFADIGYLDVIELKGVGKHYNGKALVTGWRHRVSEQGWITDLRLGLGMEWFAARSDVAARPAAGLLPPVAGLQVGVVESYEDDPAKEYRVRVRVPALGADRPALWARLATPDAGKGRGYFFRPEAGDEVVLGFFNEDPRQPVIVGALFGSANTPPDGFQDLDSSNVRKGLVSKLGSKIVFADTDAGKASLRLETAGGNLLLLDDEAGSLTLQDKHGNSLVLDDKGVTIKSAKDFIVEASGKVQLKGSTVDLN